MYCMTAVRICTGGHRISQKGTLFAQSPAKRIAGLAEGGRARGHKLPNTEIMKFGLQNEKNGTNLGTNMSTCSNGCKRVHGVTT